ncbi:MAG: rhodanese-like domain-containing protein [Vicinamibacterales bacterium]
MNHGGSGAVRVSGDEAARLLASGPVSILDVRTPGEFAQLGHLPGARLLPVDLVASAPAVLPDDGTPILVCCEHGVRSAAAAEVLVAAGLAPVYDLAGGMAAWRGARDFGSAPIAGPAGWLLEHARLLPRGAPVLDVAAGRGRHALLLAGAGWPVTAVDRDAETMEALGRVAARMGWPVTAQVLDLEAPGVDLGAGRYGAIVVVHYLHRPLVPALVAALAPGGVLFYETFTTAQAARGRPTNPDYLLEPGELPRLVAPLVVEQQREGEVDGRMVASVVARKLSAPERA